MTLEQALLQTAKSYIEVGRMKMQEGDLEIASSAVSRALVFVPDMIEAHLLSGQIYAKLKQWSNCTHNYRRALELEPHSLQTYVRLADALRQQGKKREAIAVCRQAERQGEVAPGIFRILGNIMESEKRFDEAVRFYEKFVTYEPDMVMGHTCLARCLFKTKRYGDAVHSCNMALQRGADRAEIWRIKAQSLRQLEENKSAIRCYQRFIELKSDSPGVYLELGDLLLQQQNFDAAIEYCHLAKQQEKVSPGIYRILATALQHQGNIQGAIGNYRHFLEVSPNTPWVYAALGNALHQIGQDDEAIAYFKEAVQRGHSPQQLNKKIATILKSLGQVDEALIYYQKGLENNLSNQKQSTQLTHESKVDGLIGTMSSHT